MANRDLVKRLAAIEQAIVGKHVDLIFVWTRSLAARIERAMAKHGEFTRRKIQLVCWPLNDADGAIEADVRESDPLEAARLDVLLEGRIPGE